MVGWILVAELFTQIGGKCRACKGIVMLVYHFVGATVQHGYSQRKDQQV